MELYPRSKSQLRAKNNADITEAVGETSFLIATIPEEKKLEYKNCFSYINSNF
jgi:hypothetical protein